MRVLIVKTKRTGRSAEGGFGRKRTTSSPAFDGVVGGVARACDFDVSFWDVMLPELDGF